MIRTSALPSYGLQVLARAKINLFLRVGPRRRDGYHDLLTLFQSISLSDELTIRLVPRPSRPGIRIRISERGIPAGPGNTVCRAYRFLCARYPAARMASFEVDIQKNIPHGAGLGGGSADAAAFLTGASILLGIGPITSPKILKEISGDIGSDVPFCLIGGTTIGRGRGEILTRVPPLPGRRVIIVAPKTRISTVDAYRAIDRSREQKNLTNTLSARSLKSVVDAVRKRRHVGFSVNDFQSVACRAHPELTRIHARLSRIGFSAMTGSGSAFFVLTDDRRAARLIQSAFPGARVRVARFVDCGVETTKGGKRRGSHRGEDQKIGEGRGP